MKLKLFRIISAVLLVSVMITIFMFSSQKAEDSQQTSDGFVSKIISAFYPEFKNISEEEQDEVIDNLPLPVRKVAHFSIYFAMGLFSFCTFIMIFTVNIFSF